MQSKQCHSANVHVMLQPLGTPFYICTTLANIKDMMTPRPPGKSSHSDHNNPRQSLTHKMTHSPSAWEDATSTSAWHRDVEPQGARHWQACRIFLATRTAALCWHGRAELGDLAGNVSMAVAVSLAITAARCTSSNWLQLQPLPQSRSHLLQNMRGHIRVDLLSATMCIANGKQSQTR